jgi:hypothetical protein
LSTIKKKAPLTNVCMKIGHGINSGIQEFRDLGIEGILSLLIY